MKLEYTGRNIEITEALMARINKQLRKFPKLFVEPIHIHVILSVQKHRHIAELVMTTKLFNATSLEESSDMYVSINKAIDKLERQGIRWKAKAIGNKRQLGGKAAVPVAKPKPKPESRAAARKAAAEREVEVDVKSHTPVVAESIKRKKTLVLEEALLALEGSSKDFLVYRDADTESVNIIYNRKDGKVGLIRTE